MFRKNEINLISNKLKAIDFIKIFLQEYPIDFIPSCHNLVYKLIKCFVIARIHFSLKKECNITKAATKSSRSIAMKASVSKKASVPKN